MNLFYTSGKETHMKKLWDKSWKVFPWLPIFSFSKTGTTCTFKWIFLLILSLENNPILKWRALLWKSIHYQIIISDMSQESTIWHIPLFSWVSIHWPACLKDSDQNRVANKDPIYPEAPTNLCWIYVEGPGFNKIHNLLIIHWRNITQDKEA